MTLNSNSTHAEQASAPATQVDYVSSCQLPTAFGQFQLHAFVEVATQKEHLALTLGDISDGQPVLMRVHSECLTGDALFSQRCDCGAQLQTALQKIAEQGRGVLLYLRQEGRGFGLLNKVRAYHLQDGGADTVEANEALGFAPDARHYLMVLPMLQHLNVSSVKLMSNNPRKFAALTASGSKVAEQIPLIIQKNVHNERYLQTKAAKLGHLL